MDNKTEKPHRTVFEEIEVTGGQLIDKIKDLIRSGNIRRLKVRAGDGFTLEMPVTVGALAGGVVMLTAPWLAVIGVIAAMVAKVRIEVERDVEVGDEPGVPPAAAANETAPTETDRATDA
jgi:phage terminase large subunit-like protein